MSFFLLLIVAFCDCVSQCFQTDIIHVAGKAADLEGGIVAPFAVRVHKALSAPTGVVGGKRIGRSLDRYINGRAVFGVEGDDDRKGFAGSYSDRLCQGNCMVSRIWDSPISGTLWDKSTTGWKRSGNVAVDLDFILLVGGSGIESGSTNASWRICSVCENIGKGDVCGVVIKVTPADSVVLEIGIVGIGGFCFKGAEFTK